MPLLTRPYREQAAHWPQRGRHILAQYDAETVVVYQAYRPEIGQFAARNGFFGGPFSLSRMSWVKPNFLWMMYRSNWGTKHDQEVTLAVRLRRDAFETILRRAVPSSFDARLYPDEAAWKAAVTASEVRLQWDPDHAPGGAPLARRAIQLGLRGETLSRYARDWIVAIEDISDFVAEQRSLLGQGRLDELLTPHEEVYLIEDAELAARLGVDLVDGERDTTPHQDMHTGA